MTLWSLPLLPWLTAVLLYLGRHRLGNMALASLAGLGLLLTWGVALSTGAGWGGEPGGGLTSQYAWSETLVLALELSTAGRVFAWLVPLVALPIVFYASHHEREGQARLLAMLLAFVGAMLLLVLAADLLTLLIAWELVGACSWALILHRWRERTIPGQAGQAFLVTRLGDLGLYLAAAALFAGTGRFDYTALSGLEGGLQHIAVAGIVLAAAAKSAQVPFSAWLFAAMAGPVPASALLHSATMVAAGTFLLVQLEPQLSEVAWFPSVVVGLGLATALAGGIVALFQGHAKKLLAASTSAQYGLMWVAVGVGFPGVALLHATAHACLKAGLFLATGLAGRSTNSYRLSDMRLGNRMPGVALMSLILALALAGVIPLGAAWTKEQIASAASTAGVWLALLVAVAGGLSAAYAARFQMLAFGRTRERTPPGRGPTGIEVFALAVFAGLSLVLSVLWWPGLPDVIAGALGIELPASHTWLLGVSLMVVALGIVGGVGLARRHDSVANDGTTPFLGSIRARWMADWFGLPTGFSAVARGTHTLASALARFDDGVVDQAVTRLARGLGHGAAGLARGDDRVVDAGLHATARFGQWLALLNARRGEWLAEGLPKGLMQLAGWGGRWAREAQTGQVHHYYTGMVVGLALFFVILLMGAYL
ncbi:proton-conducting transporter membrane subunit [Litchfieldella xinjiangensis]|uniref:proton-conducting transporter transmembrane domain-containing protein n=1 Tax=Litchfieldella xinjiangensis TaxID=1166948 RepID=UPI0005BC1D71|nr:proton-conducting transporter membrane subunit [Halomonas xinjiangensis]